VNYWRGRNSLEDVEIKIGVVPWKECIFLWRMNKYEHIRQDKIIELLHTTSKDYKDLHFYTPRRDDRDQKVMAVFRIKRI